MARRAPRLVRSVWKDKHPTPWGPQAVLVFCSLLWRLPKNVIRLLCWGSVDAPYSSLCTKQGTRIALGGLRRCGGAFTDYHRLAQGRLDFQTTTAQHVGSARSLIRGDSRGAGKSAGWSGGRELAPGGPGERRGAAREGARGRRGGQAWAPPWRRAPWARADIGAASDRDSRALNPACARAPVHVCMFACARACACVRGQTCTSPCPRRECRLSQTLLGSLRRGCQSRLVCSCLPAVERSARVPSCGWLETKGLGDARVARQESPGNPMDTMRALRSDTRQAALRHESLQADSSRQARSQPDVTGAALISLQRAGPCANLHQDAGVTPSCEPLP